MHKHNFISLFQSINLGENFNKKEKMSNQMINCKSLVKNLLEIQEKCH